MQEESNELKDETTGGIKRVEDLQQQIALMEQAGIPRQHQDFEDLREDIHILLDHLLIDEKIDLETSHLVRVKLRRITELFVKMERKGHFTEKGQNANDQLDFDKSKHDSKLEVVQLILGQIYPKLKEFI